MPTFPIPLYEPDRSPLFNPQTGRHVSDNIKNVIPNADGYGPLPALEVFSDALSAACKGAILAKKSDGSLTLFAGTATALYQLSGTAWTDVSSGTYSLPSEDFWSFAPFGNYVLATNIDDPLQIFNLASSTDFANAAGSPPQAAFVGTESGYVTLAKLSGNERRIQRSGLNNAEFWTVGERGCTFQDLPDGGLPQGIAGDEAGAFVFSETKVRRLINQPGQQVGFTLQDFDEARGAIAAHSIVRAGQVIAYLSETGFHILGQPSLPIGTERVDRTFLSDIDLTALSLVQGVADPVRKMFWWRYRSNSNSSTTYTDKLLGYHYHLERWTYAEVNLEWILSASSLGYTLEEIASSLAYTNLELVPYSFDSRIWRGGRPSLAAFNTDHKLCFFEGEAMEATLDSGDIPLGGEGRRVQINGYRPVGDVSGAYGKIGRSETLHGELTYTAESTQDSTGFIPARASGRKVRLRTRIPEGTTWNHVNALEIPPEAVRQGGRR